jgi:hypothetical protein
MIEMTVTYEGSLRWKLIHQAAVIFLLINNNRTGKSFALAYLITKRFLAPHSQHAESDNNLRFYC